MPVHETKGGYKYGETGKTYKNKKDAIKQAIAIAYSKAKKKGRKPSQEEITTEIKGNPEEKMNKVASVLKKEASVRKQAADLKSWLTAARNFLNSDAAKRIAIGLGTGGGAYLLSGLADKDNKYRKERLGGSALLGVLAGWKGLDAYRAAVGKRGTEASKWHKFTPVSNIFDSRIGAVLPLASEEYNEPENLPAILSPVKSLVPGYESKSELLNNLAGRFSSARRYANDAAVGTGTALEKTDYLLRPGSPAREAADNYIIDELPTSDPRWADALGRVKIQYK